MNKCIWWLLNILEVWKEEVLRLHNSTAIRARNSIMGTCIYRLISYLKQKGWASMFSLSKYNTKNLLDYFHPIVTWQIEVELFVQWTKFLVGSSFLGSGIAHKKGGHFGKNVYQLQKKLSLQPATIHLGKITNYDIHWFWLHKKKKI